MHLLKCQMLRPDPFFTVIPAEAGIQVDKKRVVYFYE